MATSAAISGAIGNGTWNETVSLIMANALMPARARGISEICPT